MISTPRNFLIIILTLAAALFMLQLDSTILNTSLKNIALDLNADPNHLQIAVVSYILTLASVIPVSVFLTDYFGTRTMFTWGIILFTGGSLLCSLATDLNQLVFSRMLQATGGGLIIPITRLAIVHFFPQQDLLRYNNYLLIPALTGQLIGPLLGGYLSELFSWHWIFLINLPVGITALVLTVFYLPDRVNRTYKFDWRGLIIFTAATLAVAAGVQFYNKSTYFYLSNRQNILLVALGFSLFLLYGIYARTRPGAIFPAALFKVHTFKIGICGNFFTRLGISALPVAIPLVLQTAFGFSAVNAGWMVFFMSIGALISKIFMLPAVQYLGFKKALLLNTVCLGIIIIGLPLLINFTTAYLILSVYLLLAGIINSAQYTLLNTLILGNLPAGLKSSGAVLATVNQQLSMGLGIALVSVLLEDFNRRLLPGAAFTAVFIIMGLFTVLCSSIFRHLRPHEGDTMLSK